MIIELHRGGMRFYRGTLAQRDARVAQSERSLATIRRHVERSRAAVRGWEGKR